VFIALLAPWKRGRVLLAATALGGIATLAAALTRTDAACAVVVLAWLSLAAVALGDLAIKAFGLKKEIEGCRLEWLGFSGILGFGCFSVCASILGWLRELNRATAFALLVLVSLLSIRRAAAAYSTLRDRFPAIRAWWTASDLRWVSAGSATLALFAVFPFLWALVPAVQWDAAAAQLPIGQAYASPRGFAAVADYWFAYVPSQAHLLYGLAFALVGQPLPSLLHFTFTVLVAVLVFSLALRTAGRVPAWIAVIAFASMPLVGWSAGSAYMDFFVTAFTFASVYAILRWRESMRNGWLLLASVLGGLGAACKASALMLLVPGLVYVLAAVIRRKKLRATAPALLASTAAIVLLPLPWFLRTWLWTGNPFYPTCEKWFPGSQPSVAFNWSNFGTGHGLLAFLRLPWDFVIHGGAFDEHGLLPLGLVPLAALGSLFFGHRTVSWRLRGLLLTLILANTLAWFEVAQVARYLLPVLPLVVVLAALPLPGILDWLQRRRHAWALAGVLLAGIGYLTYTRSVTTIWNYNLAEGYPYRYLLGRETRDQFLDRALPANPVFRYINTHRGPSSRAFSPTPQIRTYIDVPLDDPIYAARTADLVRLPPGEDFIRTLRSRGYDFLLIDTSRPVGAAYSGALLRKVATLVFAANNIYLYRTDKVGSLTDGGSADLLTNGGLDDLNETHEPAGWSKFGSPKAVVDPKAAHSGPGFVEVTQNDGWCQRVSAKPGRMYTVTLWARSSAAQQSAWLQVLWFDSSMKMLDTGITSVAVGPKWKQYDASFVAPGGTAQVQVYARAAAGNTVSVDDIHFTEERR
jgi:hypothetical protein